MYLPKPLKKLVGFGRLPLTGSHFVELCHDNQIELVISSDTSKGFYYYTPAGEHTIVLSSRLQAAERAFISWHEFAHFLQNYYNPQTTAAFCNIGERTPAENLADMFAFICTTPNVIVPRPLEYIDMIMRGGSRKL
jgi:hypothetical protein